MFWTFVMLMVFVVFTVPAGVDPPTLWSVNPAIPINLCSVTSIWLFAFAVFIVWLPLFKAADA